MWCKHFCIIFFDFSGIQTKFIPDYWTKSDDSWDSLDCPNRLSHLRAFPYDYFKILHYCCNCLDGTKFYQLSQHLGSSVWCFHNYDHPDHLNSI